MAIYLFGFVRAEGAGAGSSLPGLEPGSVTRVVVSDRIASVVVDLDAALFTGPGAEERLSDLGWIGPRALRHQEVLAALLAHGPVLPARFGTLFSGEEALAELVARNAAVVESFFGLVGDGVEWGVKGFLDRSLALESFVAAALARREGLAALPAGRRYMEERRLRAEGEKEIDGWVREAATPVAAGLTSLCREARSRAVTRGSTSEAGEEVVLSWALLAALDAREGLHAFLEERTATLAARGLRFELSGPWPPYSFVPDLDG